MKLTMHFFPDNVVGNTWCTIRSRYRVLTSCCTSRWKCGMCNLKTLHFEVSQMTKVYNINAEFIMLSFNYLFMVQKLLGEGGGKQGDRERERKRKSVPNQAWHLSGLLPFQNLMPSDLWLAQEARSQTQTHQSFLMTDLLINTPEQYDQRCHEQLWSHGNLCDPKALPAQNLQLLPQSPRPTKCWLLWRRGE